MSLAYKIGRDPSCHLVLNNHFVSRLHAELNHMGGGNAVIRDCGSANGTGIGHPKNQIKEHPLNPMDMVYFSDECAVPGCLLTKHFVEWLQSGGEKKVSLTLGDVKSFRQPEIHIGSSPKRDMCIPVLGVQPTHLKMFYQGGKWCLQDLGGGATLRGHVIGQQIAELASGDSIDIGAESLFVTFAGDHMILTRLRKGFSLECRNVKVTVKDRESGLPRDLLDKTS